MSKKIMATLAATVVVGLSLGYAATNASADNNTKSSTPQKKACCGHCGMKK